MSIEQRSPESLLFDAQGVRELDRIAIEDRGIAGIVLMKRAGKAVFSAVRKRRPDHRKMLVFCGKGNNGGDGYVVAALAIHAGLSVRLFEMSEAESVGGDAKTAREFALQSGVTPETFEESERLNLDLTDAESGTIIVDALLGTGFIGEPRADLTGVIDQINQLKRASPEVVAVVAADIPSGLEAGTGRASSHAVCADMTVTFIGQKLGLHTADGPEHCGELVFDDLGVPRDIYSGVKPLAVRLSIEEELIPLRKRPRSNHKGSQGHVLVMGGDQGMGGAPLMTAIAAQRVGAGLVSVATHPDHVPAFLTRQPELMVRGCAEVSQAESLAEKASIIAIGPGMGTTAWGQRMMQIALASGKPLVLDADALNLLAESVFEPSDIRAERVMTPHPGEAARLLGLSSNDIQSDRYSAITRLRETFGGVQILKGAGTLVYADDELGVCPYGNPGMGTGGMGDVLTGVIAGLWAQGLSAGQAARLGVCLHSRAADLLAVQFGERGMLATDLIPVIRELLNGI